jgi:hypothetical protein
MRRITFRLAVALVAFTFGTIVSFYVYQLSKKVSPIETHEAANSVFKSELNQKVDKTTLTKQKDKFVCEDKTIQLFWNDLKEHSISLNRVMEPVKNCTDFLNVQEIRDMNDDGKKEIIARKTIIYERGEDDNIWILQEQKDRRFKVIFSNRATFIEVKESRTNGYFDFQSSFRYPLGDSYGFVLHKYNGYEYAGMKCWEEMHSFADENGKLHKLENPKISSLHCG